MKKILKRLLIFLVVLVAAAYIAYKVFIEEKREISVLVFSKTEGFRHESIAAGQQAIFQLGKKHGFPVDTTEDASVFKEKQLKKYNVVVFLNTTGDILNDAQQLEFNRFIQAGGGFVGIHSATDTEYDWPWYGELVGAYFNGHPNDPNVRDAVIQKVDKTHACCQHLPDSWACTDEWYNFKDINPNINILLNLDESSYEGGTNGESHPMAWYHEFDGGRSFYTGRGHTAESFAEPEMLELIWQGIDYAAGPGKPVDYNISTIAPEENRFMKVVLDQGLNEPMELEMLPDGRLLFVERGGAIKQYLPAKKETIEIAKLNVYTGEEDGLLGMALDPDYKNNNWIYLFYSPAGEEAKQHVSRFVLKDGDLDFDSEKVVLEIPTQREECCHSAGSIEFDANGNLFIATGDDTSPRADAFAPIDEREGRSPWDAQKSSANTQDLRGKILRITPQDDGSYTIPDDNLFAKDGSEGRPEIYVMGCRNPYRIAVDDHTGFLYWGDVGPDAGEDSLGRGPMGYDEVNQAKAPGFYGWPYFIGNNYAYNDFDFKSGTSGEPFNPEKPLNESPNNTGAKALPPAQPAYIYYPYGDSKEFPLVGNGGRNAMAGKVFYHKDYPENEARYPEYYDGKLFIYDWMRGWFMAVTMDENGDFKRMERFLPSQRFNNPIDMIFSPDGDIYLLEYGTLWFSANEDARLVHLKYVTGNRQPVAIAKADATVGAIPLAVQFEGSESLDYDGDDLTYEWTFGEEGETSTEINPSFTFSNPGTYDVTLKVTDSEGISTESQITIKAGNELPQIEWEMVGNKSFYFDNQTINYAIKVSDKEDGEFGNGIAANDVFVSIDYLEQSQDINEIAMGHKEKEEDTQYALGKRLMDASDCATCHQMDKKSVGPTYLEIAEKYKNDAKAISYLAEKVVKGGGGVWGETIMAAHPQLSQSEAEQMSKYILSLSEEAEIGSSLPVNGRYTLDQHKPSHLNGRYIFTASYTDKGGQSIGPLTSRQMLTLRNPMIGAVNFDDMVKAMKFKVEPGMAPGVEEEFEIVIGNHDGYTVYKNIDFTGVNTIELGGAQAGSFFGGGTIELRLDAPDGEVTGTANVEQGLTDFGEATFNVSLKPVEGFHDLYVYFKAADDAKPVVALIYLKFKNEQVALQ